MSLLTRNLVANFAGQGWTTVLGLIAVPLYIHLMGIESYGLIGFYTTVQIIMPLVDFGITPTINRTMARYSVQPNKANEIRDFVRTCEVVYWSIGSVVGLIIFVGSPWIATNWIKPVHLSIIEVQQVVRMIGILIFLQFPFGLYQGALLGLQEQVKLNVIIILMATLRVVGVLLILWCISSTITAFFTWQIFISICQVITISNILWRSVPIASKAPQINLSIIRESWQFAAGMSGITISALVLTQIDKVILSKLLSLEVFGYYTLAGVVTMGLAVVIIPIYNVFFPRFSALVAYKDEFALCESYHLGTQLMAVLVLPLALTIAFFSNEIFVLWLGSAETARNAAPISSVLIIGTALNGLMYLPYALQLAHGWTSLGLRINIIFVILLVPTIIYLTLQYGAIGAAAVWIGLNLIYMLFGVPLTHRRVLKHEARRWFVSDTGIPFLGILICVWLGRQFVSSTQTRLEWIITIGLVLSIAVLVAVVLADQVRTLVWQMFKRVRAVSR